jgi:hypothetical protein
MNSTQLLPLLAALWLLPALCQGEIYKWTDQYGVTHYSEAEPEDHQANEVSEQLKDTVNFIEFKKTVAIDYIQFQGKSRPASVKINIELIDYQLDAAARKTIKTQVKTIYQAYHRWFGWDAQPDRPVTIKIFGDFNAFEDYQKGESYAHVTSRSHYSSRRREVVMLGTEFTTATLQVLYHEVSHAIIHMEMMAIPKWINEGLAEVFETITSRNGRIGVGVNKAWVEIIQHKLREGSLDSFKDYISIANRQWNSESARVERSYYIVAWSMMRFLLSSPQGADSLQQVITACKKQPWWQKDKLASLFADAYPGGIVKLDADWRMWIKNLKL